MATSTTPMSETPPGTYDPSSASPYPPGRSGAGGDGGGPPQITAPPPSAVSQEPPPTAPSVLPGAKGSKAASIAYGLDAVLRGAMRGREQAQQQSAYKANKLIQGFQYAYKNASDQYLGMLQNDPALAAKLGELDKIGKTKSPTPEQQARAKEISSDPSVVKAQQVASHADSAWEAQQQMYNYYLNPQWGKKPKSSKSKGGDQSGDAQNPVMQIQSKDPMEKLQGFLAISKAAGPSYKREAAYLMSPEYQQSRANAVGEQQITSDIQSKRIELHKLQNADPATLDDKAKQRLNQLQEDPELFPQLSRTVPHYGTSDIPGSSLANAKDPSGAPLHDKFGNAIDPKQNYRIETIGGVQSYVPSVAKSSTKPPNRDDRYIGILEKQSLGQPLSDEDKAYLHAYQLYVKQTKIDPGVARAAAFGAARFVPVLDPKNPENVIYMRASEAANSGVGTPQSISFQIDKAITKAFTSGQPATNINFFNTAVDHLTLLGEAADALKNGDTQVLNKAGNAWAAATGNPAPTDFNAVRNAVAGELAKTFTGARATKEEINLMNETINSAMSPEQLASVTEYYKRLMGGKLSALKSQYETGKEGKPAFKDENSKHQTSSSGGPSTGGSTGGSDKPLTPEQEKLLEKHFPIG